MERCFDFPRIGLSVLATFVLITSNAPAQTTSFAWNWIGGIRNRQSGDTAQTVGTPHPDNHPGSSIAAQTWRAHDGSLWLFEKDLWSFDRRSRQWTLWRRNTSAEHRGTVAGPPGVFHQSNFPGERTRAATWVDREGYHWMFGGIGRDSRGNRATLGDMWKFDPARGQWALVGNRSIRPFDPAYVDRGTPSEQANPGGRFDMAFGTTTDGRFWIFGGSRLEDTFEKKWRRLSDLWFFDPATGRWTWANGPDTINVPSRYPSLAGGEGEPGARIGARGYTDPAGNIWIFGGAGLDGRRTFGPLGDLWKFDPVAGRWHFMAGDTVIWSAGNRGALGSSSAAHRPRSRHHGILWGTPDGSLYLFGGGVRAHQNGEYVAWPDTLFNDLWRFTPSSGQWSWIGGDSTKDSPGFYSRKEVTLPENEAGSGASSATWVDPDGRLWRYGGYSITSNMWDEPTESALMETFDPASRRWTWVEGNRIHMGYAGAPDGSPLNWPSLAVTPATWIGRDGSLMMYNPAIREMWRYQPTTGVWHPRSIDTSIGRNHWVIRNTGSPLRGNSVHGTRGVPSAASIPGMRTYALSWSDTQGNLWMYGGYGNSGVANNGNVLGGTLADMWKYDPVANMWAWMGGDTTSAQGVVVYGNAPHTPGARYSAAGWSGPDGDLWLFGGYGEKKLIGTHFFEHHNDLWRFDIETLTWSLIEKEPGGSAPRIGRPRERANAAYGKDPQGRFLIYGGMGVTPGDYGVVLGDLWRYDPSLRTWTHLTGDSEWGIESAVYGELGVASATAKPGSRSEATIWGDGEGRVYLYGGAHNYTSGNIAGRFNDLWRFDPATDMWTWLAGDSVPNMGKRVVAQGVAHPLNVPDASDEIDGSSPRSRGSWTDGSAFWMFSGGDLWKLDGAFGNKRMPLDAGPDITMWEGDSVTIGPLPAARTSYTWSDAAGTQARARVAPGSTHTYFLRAFDSATGAVGLDSVLVTVKASPSALFVPSVDAFTLTATPVPSSASTFFWSFGDGATSTEREPQHTYSAAGTYKVRLIAAAERGADTLERTVVVTGISGISAPRYPDALTIEPTVAVDRTDVALTLASPSRVRVVLIDERGDVVRSGPDELRAAGEQRIPVSVADLPAGRYFVRVHVGERVGIAVVVVVR